MDIDKNYYEELDEMVPDHSRIERIKIYINETLSGDLRATTVSQKFELSVSTLLHLFQQQQKQSYHQYVEDVRMGKAFYLVQQGKRVKEVIHATGYKNRSTFYNAFKKKFKHPPRYFSK
ncbi:MAG: AraC family transcriptional regulator [Ginsengibacter sp.]